MFQGFPIFPEIYPINRRTFRILTSLGVEVVAMTRANFSDESALVYTGVSSYTRCTLLRLVGCRV